MRWTSWCSQVNVRGSLSFTRMNMEDYRGHTVMQVCKKRAGMLFESSGSVSNHLVIVLVATRIPDSILRAWNPMLQVRIRKGILSRFRLNLFRDRNEAGQMLLRVARNRVKCWIPYTLVASGCHGNALISSPSSLEWILECTLSFCPFNVIVTTCYPGSTRSLVPSYLVNHQMAHLTL